MLYVWLCFNFLRSKLLFYLTFLAVVGLDTAHSMATVFLTLYVLSDIYFPTLKCIQTTLMTVKCVYLWHPQTKFKDANVDNLPAYIQYGIASSGTPLIVALGGTVVTVGSFALAKCELNSSTTYYWARLILTIIDLEGASLGYTGC